MILCGNAYRIDLDGTQNVPPVLRPPRGPPPTLHKSFSMACPSAVPFSSFLTPVPSLRGLPSPSSYKEQGWDFSWIRPDPVLPAQKVEGACLVGGPAFQGYPPPSTLDHICRLSILTRSRKTCGLPVRRPTIPGKDLFPSVLLSWSCVETSQKDASCWR